MNQQKVNLHFEVMDTIHDVVRKAANESIGDDASVQRAFFIIGKLQGTLSSALFNCNEMELKIMLDKWKKV